VRRRTVSPTDPSETHLWSRPRSRVRPTATVRSTADHITVLDAAPVNVRTCARGGSTRHALSDGPSPSRSGGCSTRYGTQPSSRAALLPFPPLAGPIPQGRVAPGTPPIRSPGPKSSCWTTSQPPPGRSSYATGFRRRRRHHSRRLPLRTEISRRPHLAPRLTAVFAFGRPMGPGDTGHTALVGMPHPRTRPDSGSQGSLCASAPKAPLHCAHGTRVPPSRCRSFRSAVARPAPTGTSVCGGPHRQPVSSPDPADRGGIGATRPPPWGAKFGSGQPVYGY
jgi:hypothetical protein